jgi:hypothetical protein
MLARIMSINNIIAMAHEAQFEGFGNGDWVCTTEEIERLVTIVENAQAKRMHDEGFVTVGHMRQQIAAEREACAKVCETKLGPTSTDYYGKTYAAAIRARKQS